MTREDSPAALCNEKSFFFSPFFVLHGAIGVGSVAGVMEAGAMQQQLLSVPSQGCCVLLALQPQAWAFSSWITTAAVVGFPPLFP